VSYVAGCFEAYMRRFQARNEVIAVDDHRIRIK
jgi:hypothetical protein